MHKGQLCKMPALLMLRANLKSRLAISLAVLLIISLALNAIITNSPVKAQVPPSISGTGSGTITFGISCPTSSPFHDPGGINFNANLNPDGTVITGAFNVIDFNPLVTDFTKYSGQVTGGSVSESSCTLTIKYFECGQEQTGTITGQCGTNQQITLETTTTGKAGFTGTGSVFCPIIQPLPTPGCGPGTDNSTCTLPTQTTIISAIDGKGNPVQNAGRTSSTSMTFQVTATPGSNPIAGFECSLDGSDFSTCANTNPSTISYNNLVAGQQHTFAVRAVDTQGNTDPNPATFSWTISIPPSQTAITLLKSAQL